MSYILSKKYARKSDSDFVVAAARAFYVCWWADREEELGRCYPGQEFTNDAPETQRWAFKLARKLVLEMYHQDRIPLSRRLTRWEKEAAAYPSLDREPTEANFGWYAAMSAMGHGVGLPDMGVNDRMPCISNDH